MLKPASSPRAGSELHNLNSRALVPDQWLAGWGDSICALFHMLGSARQVQDGLQTFHEGALLVRMGIR